MTYDWPPGDRLPGKIVVFHSGYGCETGCCGHTIKTDAKERFVFDHPDEGDDLRAWAEEQIRKEFGDEHVKDLDWEHCWFPDYDCGW